MSAPRSRRRRPAPVALLSSILLAACGGTGPVEPPPDEPQALAPKPAGLRVEDAWVNAPPPGIGVLAAYMRIDNGTDRVDRLLRADSPAASECEMHETLQEGDTLRMVHREEGIDIPARGSLALQPGGAHLMLFGVGEGLKAGDTLPLRLHFEVAGTLEVTLEVREPQG